ncbi:MAG: TetR family transcriptional regulator [Tistlia sp.]|uniref:TetR family transcriptional regulator n=1 Tax=Tistlia sp. TaxID=3057121 RepID=UPI0034A53B62
MATRKQKPPAQEAAIDAALALAAERDWADIGLAEIAEAAGVSLAELYPRIGSKQALLDAFSRRVDAAVLAEPAPGPETSPRDRLFDVLMRRFDALQPHRRALASILRAQARAPGATLCGLVQLARSMAWMLAAAGLSADGLRGIFRVKGLSAIYLATFRVFLRDDSPDLSRTMATLDASLRRVEWLAARLERGRGRRGFEAAGEPAVDPGGAAPGG